MKTKGTTYTDFVRTKQPHIRNISSDTQVNLVGMLALAQLYEEQTPKESCFKQGKIEFILIQLQLKLTLKSQLSLEILFCLTFH